MRDSTVAAPALVLLLLAAADAGNLSVQAVEPNNKLVNDFVTDPLEVLEGNDCVEEEFYKLQELVSARLKIKQQNND